MWKGIFCFVLGDELNASGDNRSDNSNKQDKPAALLKSALTTLVIHILSTAATSFVSEYTMNHITKFLIQTFKDLVQDNKQGWGNFSFHILSKGASGEISVLGLRLPFSN